jgi:hypothetical protein
MNLPAADANNDDGALTVTAESGAENASGTEKGMATPDDNAVIAVGHKQLPVAPTTMPPCKVSHGKHKLLLLRVI